MMIDTKQKILDTAERLIAEQGYASTSLRHIISEAGVNLAAVHYHFGSKEELLDALVNRKAGPVNERRMAELNRIEAEANGQPAPIEAVLEAFLMPMAEAANGNPQFVRVMGRILAEGMMRAMIEKNFRTVIERFTAALRQTLRDLPEGEFQWRIQFMQGAMAHTMCGLPEGDFRARVRLLIRFLSGGFLAPAVEAQ